MEFSIISYTLSHSSSKVLPRVTSPGPTGNKPTFFFPQSPTTPSAGKSSTLGRIKATSQIQSTPIPLHPMRPRSSSDAKRQVKHASGIPMPTPPPSYRGHSHKHSIGSTSMSSTSGISCTGELRKTKTRMEEVFQAWFDLADKQKLIQALLLIQSKRTSKLQPVSECLFDYSFAN